jgi:hypothetical protein
MLKLEIFIDDLSQEVIALQEKMYDEFNARRDERGTYRQRAVKVSFMLATEYFYGATHLLSHEEFMAGIFVRANIENLSSMLLVLNSDEHAESYIEKGMKKFANKMNEAFMKEPDEIFDEKLLTFAKVNPWAFVPIVDKNSGEPVIDKDGNPRVKPLSITKMIEMAHSKGFPYLMNVYGYYCFFTHPNPGVVRFCTEKRKDEHLSQIAVMLIDNHVLLLEMMKIAIRTWNIQAVSVEDVEVLEAKLPKYGLMHVHVLK